MQRDSAALGLSAWERTMDEDDDDDYEEHVKDPSDQTPCRIQVDGVSKDDLVSAIVDRVVREYARRMDHEIQVMISGVIQKQVDAAVVRICEQELDAQIRDLITQGWQPCDWNGEPRGERVTLKKRILDVLDDLVSVTDGRNTDARMKRIKVIMRDEVDKAFRGELATMIEGFKQDAKKMLDTSFKERVAAAIKEAFKM